MNTEQKPARKPSAPDDHRGVDTPRGPAKPSSAPRRYNGTKPAPRPNLDSKRPEAHVPAKTARELDREDGITEVNDGSVRPPRPNGGFRGQRKTTPSTVSTKHYPIDKTGSARAPRNKEEHVSDGEPVVRFAALGGLEEIGRNMSFFEYKNEIVAIDAGIQFPEEETPGIDYIIPNASYFESKKGNVKALLITHAHFDHIGAIPYIIGKMGNPPIYTTPLAREMILKRQAEFVNAPKLDIRTIKDGDKVKLSENFSAEFFGVSHSVPDTTGIILTTPVGNMATFADFKIETDIEGKPVSLDNLYEIAKKDIHTVFLDSTNAESVGWSPSERVVEKNLEEIFRKAEGRIIVGIFSTLISRIGEIIKIAEKLDRKVAFSGRSIKENTEIARNLGYIKIKSGTLISPEEISKYNDKKVLILSTGAQGESNASLMKIVTGEHKHLRIKPGDSIVFSSSVIPGNERSVQGLKDNLVRQGAMIYHYKMLDIHTTGHASQEEIKTILSIVKPKFFIPIHGYLFMRTVNARNGMEAGLKKENIFLPDNGQFVGMKRDAMKITGDEIPADYVMVDGLGVGDVGEVVLRDRRLLAQEGMIVIIATVSRKDGKLVKNPDIISRGFIYLKENQKILEDIRIKIRGIVGRLPHDQTLDPDYLKTLFRDQIGQFVYSKTYRRPMVLPVIIEI